MEVLGIAIAIIVGAFVLYLVAAIVWMPFDWIRRNPDSAIFFGYFVLAGVGGIVWFWNHEAGNWLAGIGILCIVGTIVYYKTNPKRK